MPAQRIPTRVPRGVFQPAGRARHARIVDQRIQLAPSAGQVFKHGKHLGFVRDVRDAGAQGRMRGTRSLARLRVHIADMHVGARLQKLAGNGQADAVRPCGDEDALAFL
ncbi:hypothetical protein G6F40_016635 [Rhizopus arrhizus]|nr:hypothetical protein G6F40_016635 [Rhizopus arrhizus]